MTPHHDLDLWARLVDLEPRLADLESEARGFPGGYWRQLDHWYRCMKLELVPLIGRCRTRPGDELLFTSRAYDEAYDHLFGLLTSPRRRRRAV